MKKSDFGVVAVIYAVALLFFLKTIELPEEAQTYPLGLIAALTALNTLYLLRQGWAAFKSGHITNDLPTIFSGFQPKQFFSVALFGVGYLVLMVYGGYYVATALYLVGTLLFLRVPLWQIVLTSGGLAGLIYGVFTAFLSVPLPKGIWFS